MLLLELFRRQKELLDTFLATGAISQAQHDKSLNCLIEKMDSKRDAGENFSKKFLRDCVYYMFFCSFF